MLLSSAGDFLHKLGGSKRLRDRIKGPANSAQHRDLWRELAVMGWLSMRLPESLGGAGLTISLAGELAEAFGAGLLPAPFATSAIIPSAIVRAMRAGADRDAMAGHLVDGSRFYALAFQEELGELEPAWSAQVVQQGEQLRLTGRKILVDSEADALIVAAQFNGEPVVVLVATEKSRSGNPTQRLADGGAVSTIYFDDVPLDSGSIVLRGRAAKLAVQEALDEGRLVLSAYLSGIAKGALSLTRTHIIQRVQFGQPLASFQVIRHRFVDLDMQCRLASASWRKAALSIGGASAAEEVSAAKARSSEAAVAVSRAAVQLHGAMGYTEEADIGLYLKAALTAASALGNADAHRRRFAENTFLRKIPA